MSVYILCVRPDAPKYMLEKLDANGWITAVESKSEPELGHEEVDKFYWAKQEDGVTLA